MVSDASSAGTTVDPGGEKSSYISAKHQPFTQCNFQPRKMTHTYLPRYGRFFYVGYFLCQVGLAYLMMAVRVRLSE